MYSFDLHSIDARNPSDFICRGAYTNFDYLVATNSRARPLSETPTWMQIIILIKISAVFQNEQSTRVLSLKADGSNSPTTDHAWIETRAVSGSSRSQIGGSNQATKIQSILHSFLRFWAIHRRYITHC